MNTVTLKTLFHQNRIRAIDYYFACFMQQKKADEQVALCAALLSAEDAKGNICMQLEDFAGREWFKDQESEGICLPPLTELEQQLSEHPWVSHACYPSPLVLDRHRLYLGKYWQYEQQVAKDLMARIHAKPFRLDMGKIRQGLEQLFPASDPSATNWQAIAAAMVLLNHFTVISGGPGTGKTTTILKVIALLLQQQPDLRIALVAPTGKAAARMSESIQNGLQTLPGKMRPQQLFEGKTIQRLLEYKKHNKQFYYHKHNPLPVDVLIVDEASMLDLVLTSQLLEAVPQQARVVLLGDRDQLASVEAGNVLGDISGHGKEVFVAPQRAAQLQQLGLVLPAEHIATDAPAIHQSIALLRQSYRFDQNSPIASMAAMVRQKKGQQALELLQAQTSDHYGFFDTAEPNTYETIIQLAAGFYRQYLHCTRLDDAMQAFKRFRVLCALRVGRYGAQNINKAIEHSLYQQGDIRGGEFYHGKVIMITRNDYEQNLFNGDTGLIWKDQQGNMAAWFERDHGYKKVELVKLPPYESAYAITIHKSQGSEFDKVLLVLPEKQAAVYNRELVYTGITRAREGVYLATQAQSFVYACRQQQQRSSGLAELLGWQQ